MIDFLILFSAGPCCSSSCNLSSYTYNSVKQSISIGLCRNCMFFPVFIIHIIWGKFWMRIPFPPSLTLFGASSYLLVYEATFDNLITFLQKPSAWNLQALQVWLQSVIVTKDFLYFIYCLTFVTSHLYLKCELQFGLVWFVLLVLSNFYRFGALVR